jgi:hypothetical protein
MKKGNLEMNNISGYKTNAVVVAPLLGIWTRNGAKSAGRGARDGGVEWRRTSS